MRGGLFGRRVHLVELVLAGQAAEGGPSVVVGEADGAARLVGVLRRHRRLRTPPDHLDLVNCRLAGSCAAAAHRRWDI